MSPVANLQAEEHRDVAAVGSLHRHGVDVRVRVADRRRELGEQSPPIRHEHAHARHATVDLGYEPRWLRLEVRDDGRGQAAANGSPGHGLVGIRERVKLYGGEMTAGPAPGGGFRLQVVLPLEGEAS